MHKTVNYNCANLNCCEYASQPSHIGGLFMPISARTFIAAVFLTFGPCGPAVLGQDAPPIPVTLPKVETIVDWDEYTGRFQAVERVEIRARVSGYLDKVLFEDGQLVPPGTPLFVIDQRPFEIALDAAQADLDAAKARADLADREAERARNLRESRAISQEEFEARQSQVAETAAQVRSAQAAVDRAELDMEFTTITSPIGGRVGTDLVTRGNLVSGGTNGTTLLTTVVSEDPIYFTFEVSESEFLKYSRLYFQGDRPSSRDEPNPVQVRLLDEEEYIHTGVMDFVDNELDPTSGTLRGRAVISNPGGFLQPGQFGRLRLLGSGEYEAILVPDSVVQSEQSQKYIYVVDGQNMVKRKFVELGPIYEGLRVIRSGLEASDSIAVGGFHRIRPGMTVAPQMQSISAAE